MEAAKNNDKISFYEFVDVWNTVVEDPPLTVPKVHEEIINFLEKDDNWKNDTAVLELWRGVGKSTLVGLFIVWKLVQNPKLTFLIISSSESLSKKMVKHCKSIIYRHPYAQHLMPQSKKNERAQWSSTSFLVTGAIPGREASVSCFGISSRMTGARCNYLIFDDIETLQTAGTEEKYENMADVISEAAKFKTPKGKTLYIGTPWATKTIYEEKTAAGASQLKLELVKNLKGAFPDFTGTSRWPDRFDDAYIKQIQRECKTESDFLAQYQLVPAQDTECVFNPEKLVKYDEEIQVVNLGLRTIYQLCGETLISVSAFVDPALNRKRSDDAVMAIVYMSESGKYYIHRTYKLTGDIFQQCEQIRSYVLQFNLPSVMVEDNGVGANLGTVLRKYVRAVNCSVVEERTTENKEKKIEGTFSIPINTQAMCVSKHVYDPSVSGSKFIHQLRGFTGKANYKKDDYIDVVAMAMAAQPIRLGRGVIPSEGRVNTGWRGDADGMAYKTDAIEW